MPTVLDHALRALARLRAPGIRRAINRLRPAERIAADRAGFQTRFAGLSYRGSLAEYIDRDIFYFGCYSPGELDFLDQAARRLAGGRPLNYFDVGANVGQHALWMSRRADQVFAFEPSAQAVAQMRANLAANAIVNVTVFPVALGAARGTANLGTGFKHNAGSRSLLWSLDEAEAEIVEVHHGATFFADNALPKIDLLKLDVEGFESQVLNGLAARLINDRPVIMMELIGPDNRKAGFASEAELRSALYPDHRLYSLRGRRIARLGPFNWDVEEIVCLPAERVEAFRDLILDPEHR